jgi:type IV pilus assembly protein PilM
MSFLNKITRLVKDPPPSHLFELSEAGIAFAHDGNTGFQPLEPGDLLASPVEDNLIRSDAVAGVIRKVAPANGSKKARPAAVILPDYAARVTVLDFDAFPSAAEEQLSLVRFRVKKTVPFDIDSAAVTYYVQPSHGEKASASKRVDVIAVTVSLEVIARYEALFRNSGFHPGIVTTSTLAALNLYHGEGVAVFAKLSGHVMTAAVMAGHTIKLFRCVSLDEATEDEILSVLHPTFAYVEDELSSPVSRLILCGFPHAPQGMPCEIEPLKSRLGAPGAFNAGLLGYLELGEN